jgi:hypothetical protein
MNLLSDSRDYDGNRCCTVDEDIIVNASPSSVLNAVERYVDARHNVLDLIVPIRDAGRFGLYALYGKISVRYEAQHDESLLTHRKDRLSVEFRRFGEELPFFLGRFDVVTLGTKTHLQLKGHYTAPSEVVSLLSLGRVFDPAIVAMAMRILLQELKAVIEAEYQTLKACDPLCAVN